MITIQKATANDVNAIVAIHNQAFSDFFLTSLGDSFLRLYYRCMCKCKEAVTLCAIEDNKVVGFSTTALKSAGFNTRLIKNNLIGFIMEGVRLFFSSPSSLFRLFKNFTKKSSDVADDGEYAELFSIGVLPTCQGKGIGGLLLADTESVVRKCGVIKLSLTTDYNNNDSAIAFYQRNGYRILYKFIAYPNREMYRFIKDLK